MQVGIVKTPNAGAVAIDADGVEREVSYESGVSWGDVIENRSGTPLEIEMPALEAGQGANLLVLQPGAVARLEELGSNLIVDEPNRTKVIAQSEGVELFDISEDINAAVLEEDKESAAAMGLVGAGVLGGGGLVAAGLGAVGVAALASDSDSGNAGDGAGEDSLGGVDGGDLLPFPDNQGDGSTSAGVAGGVQNLSDGIEQTPLAPVAAVTDAVADGLIAVGDGVGGASEGDPSGVSGLLSDVIGNSDTEGSDNDGVVGLLNSVSTGLDEGAEGTPLETLVDPVSGTLGSDDGAVSGVADGVAAVGTTLGLDDTFLEPVTNDVLSPIVGDNDGEQSGLGNTLDQVSSGLDQLTEEGSALEPLSPVTDGVGTGVEAVSAGVDQVGDAIFDAGLEDPTGLLETAGDLLGGDATGTDSVISSQSTSGDVGGLIQSIDPNFG